MLAFIVSMYKFCAMLLHVGYVIHWLLTTGIEPLVAVARSATRRLATAHSSAYLLGVM